MANWQAVAYSADGGKLAALVGYPGGGLYTSQATAPPVLSISGSNGNALISWIVPSVDFRLQENSGLTTTDWMDVTNTPTLNLTNLQNQVIVPLPTGNRFYRLKQ
jgi:hypothetical protein